jgi:hypothetical protein
MCGRSILYKTNGQSTPMKHSPSLQSPMKMAQPPSTSRPPQHSPLVFTTAAQRPSPGATATATPPARSQSPPPSGSMQQCPTTPTRDRTPVKDSFRSPSPSPVKIFTTLSQPSASRTPAQHRTPGRPPPPAPPNTPSITQFFAAVAGKAVPKDLAMPVRSAPLQSVTTGHKRKSTALSRAEKASCLKKGKKTGGRLSKRLCGSDEDAVENEWEEEDAASRYVS